jgi:hypothetical protein
MDFKPDIVVLTSGCICTKSDPPADGARSFKPRNSIPKIAKLEKIDDSYIFSDLHGKDTWKCIQIQKVLKNCI